MQSWGFVKTSGSWGPPDLHLHATHVWVMPRGLGSVPQPAHHAPQAIEVPSTKSPQPRETNRSPVTRFGESTVGSPAESLVLNEAHLWRDPKDRGHKIVDPERERERFWAPKQRPNKRGPNPESYHLIASY